MNKKDHRASPPAKTGRASDEAEIRFHRSLIKLLWFDP